MMNRKLSQAWMSWLDARQAMAGVTRAKLGMRRAAAYFINRTLARGWYALLEEWAEMAELRASSKRRRALHRELIRAQRAAKLLYLEGPTSEFMARSVYDAKMVRLRRDLSEDRLASAFGPTRRPLTASGSRNSLRTSSSTASLSNSGSRTKLAAAPSVPVLQGRVRPQSARGLARSSSAAAIASGA